MRIQNQSPTIVVTVEEVAAALTNYFAHRLDGRGVGNLRKSEFQRLHLIGANFEAWVGELTFELTTESK